MAAYVRQADQVTIMLSKSEARALLFFADRAFDVGLCSVVNGATVRAADRAIQSLAASTNRGASVAGYFPASD